MSLGSRIIKRGQTAVFASASASVLTPREALLFLYPAFSTHHARTASSISHEKPADGPASRGNWRKDPESPEKAKGLTRNVEHDHNRGAVLASGFFQQTPKPPRAVRSTSKEKCPTIVRYISKNLVQRKRLTLRKSQVRDSRHIDRAQSTQNTIPDWRELLERLCSRTPERSATWHNDALRIKIPAEHVHAFLYDVDGSIWDIRKRTGAHIELAQEASPDSNFLILSGPATSISKAAAEISKSSPVLGTEVGMAGDYLSAMSTKGKDTKTSKTMEQAVDDLRVGDENFSPPLRISRVRSFRRAEMSKPMRADQVPQPQEWTKSSFGHYVQHLTSIRMTRDLYHHFYGRQTDGAGGSHVDRVVEVLQELFADPSMANVLSTSALNDALAYLVKHQQIRQARELFVMMETCLLRFETTTFNILLEGPSKAQDYFSFRYLLDLMAKHKCVPDPTTWLNFLRMISDVSVKKVVLREMSDRHLIHDYSIRAKISTEFVPTEIEWSLSQMQTQDAFLAHMDERYSPSWLTLESANLVIKCLASRGLISRCWDFFKVMEERGVQPDAVTINTVLSKCLQTWNIKGGLDILHRADNLFRIKYDLITYDTLLASAWRVKAYNMAAVVWRYACLNASTTYQMRERVWRSIKSATWGVDSEHNVERYSSLTPSMTMDRFFDLTAGSFVLRHQWEILADIEDNPTAPSVNLSYQTDEIGGLIRQSTESFKYWTPARPFVDILLEAYQKDVEWRARRLLSQPWQGTNEDADRGPPELSHQPDVLTESILAKRNSEDTKFGKANPSITTNAEVGTAVEEERHEQINLDKIELSTQFLRANPFRIPVWPKPGADYSRTP